MNEPCTIRQIITSRDCRANSTKLYRANSHSENFCQPSSSERYDRVQRRREEQRLKESVFLNVAYLILQETVDAAVQSEVMEILEEDELVTNSSANVADQLIVESVDCCLELIIKEELQSKFLRFAEGKCDCSTQIKSLREELAACYSKIDGLLLQLKQSSQPFGSEEALNTDEKVLTFTGLPNMKVLQAIFQHVVTTFTSEGNWEIVFIPTVHMYLNEAETKLSCTITGVSLQHICNNGIPSAVKMASPNGYQATRFDHLAR